MHVREIIYCMQGHYIVSSLELSYDCINNRGILAF